jgi:hypothetical protein
MRLGGSLFEARQSKKVGETPISTNKIWTWSSELHVKGKKKLTVQVSPSINAKLYHKNNQHKQKGWRHGSSSRVPA